MQERTLNHGRPIELLCWRWVRAGDRYVPGAVLELEETPGVRWVVLEVRRVPADQRMAPGAGLRVTVET